MAFNKHMRIIIIGYGRIGIQLTNRILEDNHQSP